MGGQHRKINPKSLAPTFSLCRRAGIDAALAKADFLFAGAPSIKNKIEQKIQNTKVASAKVAFATVRGFKVPKSGIPVFQFFFHIFHLFRSSGVQIWNSGFSTLFWVLQDWFSGVLPPTFGMHRGTSRQFPTILTCLSLCSMFGCTPKGSYGNTAF